MKICSQNLVLVLVAAASFLLGIVQATYHPRVQNTTYFQIKQKTRNLCIVVKGKRGAVARARPCKRFASFKFRVDEMGQFHSRANDNLCLGRWKPDQKALKLLSCKGLQNMFLNKMRFTSMTFNAIDHSISFFNFGWDRVLEIVGDNPTIANMTVISNKRNLGKVTQTWELIPTSFTGLDNLVAAEENIVDYRMSFYATVDSSNIDSLVDEVRSSAAMMLPAQYQEEYMASFSSIYLEAFTEGSIVTDTVWETPNGKLSVLGLIEDGSE